MKNNIKKLILSCAALCLLGAANAQPDDKQGWQLELKRMALNLTSTQVKHAREYAGYPDSRLTADSQSLIQGVFNFDAAYHTPRYLWDNILNMEYGKTTVKPASGRRATSTENTDKISLTSDIAYRLWTAQDFLGGFDAGPFANISYETEFTAQVHSPRKEVVRARIGPKIFDGKYIKNLYAAAVLEEDFTYNPDNSFNSAWEAGFQVEHTLREGVKATYGALFRDYISRGITQRTDLDYEFEAHARMDVLVYKNLAIAPFISYYLAQGKYVSELGENLYIGVSFSFSHIFKAARPVAK